MIALLYIFGAVGALLFLLLLILSCLPSPTVSQLLKRLSRPRPR